MTAGCFISWAAVYDRVFAVDVWMAKQITFIYFIFHLVYSLIRIYVANWLGMSQQNILSVKGSCNGIIWAEVFGAVLKPYKLCTVISLLSCYKVTCNILTSVILIPWKV